MELRTVALGVLVAAGLVLSGAVRTGFALHQAELHDQSDRRLATTADAAATAGGLELASATEAAGNVDARRRLADWPVDREAIAAVSVVVSELCRNGLLYNDRPEDACELRVTVSGGSEAGTAELTVADNGSGLPSNERDLLAGDREPTNVEHGSGLGP